MASKVEVLCPNGRRVFVKTLNNTKILQILEEACLKQDFLPASDYEIKHGRRSLDVSLSVQLAALPNLAKLELVRLTKPRVESAVVIALQLSDGQRLQGEFLPSETLWSMLEYFDAKSETGEKCTSSSSAPSHHPVCIYTKDETVGEYALRHTTLRNLGLTSGRAIIRLVFRELTEENLAEIRRDVDKEQLRLTRVYSEKTVLDPSSSSVPPQPSVAETSSLACSSTTAVVSSEPMELSTPVELDSSIDAGWNAARLTTIFPESPFHQMTSNNVTFNSMVPANTYAPSPFADFKFPEETKGKNVYRNELSDVNREELKPCDRETVLYSLDEPQPECCRDDEEIPDEFYEVTESDIRKMWQDLQRRTNEILEQPLITQTTRQQQLEAKMSRYKRVIIRIQFPDRLVIQGLFRTSETVFALYKFVKDQLQDRNTEFELYTTPPKAVLKDMCQNLVEANLAPMSVIYFGSRDKRDQLLSDAVLQGLSSQLAANRVLVTSIPQSPSLASVDSSASPSVSSSAQGAAWSSSSAAAAGPSTSRKPAASSASTSSASSGQVPKWFKTGKK